MTQMTQMAAAMLLALTLAARAEAQGGLIDVMTRHGVELPGKSFEAAFDAGLAPTVPVTAGSFAMPLAMLAAATGGDRVAAAYAFGILAGRSATPASPAVAAPARIAVSPPSEMRTGSGPYTVPISISGATRLSTLTISVTYNPALVRVRSVQEGTFMRQGGVTPAFTSQIDEKSGRVDLVITRPGDQTGASSAGLLAALLIEPVAAGTGSLSVTGSASVPGGASVQLQFLPAGITVR